ncbi:LOW QUALITY PROTEIN: serine protease 38 [Physeter macrocephalus]|uniref:tryptase n=1 Tax=Physeter macrocephalus TaxID=9755 RepID=A0A2Y9F2P0_PHYMC|nr:LOW QUALITY PROTEIN: serine protease 38 [Physeter catodon]|eukprot:XP_007113989.2 LOW QUALITY PROTEIN: serine protease 38 [Physeter catodon]
MLSRFNAIVCLGTVACLCRHKLHAVALTSMRHSHLMDAALTGPHTGPGESRTPSLLKLLFLLSHTLAAATAYRHPASEGVAFSHDVACGQHHMQRKIMGGVVTLEKKWPWQVSVHYAGFHICGGSIIDEYWIMSAAHCFDRNKITEAFDMYVGLVDLRVAGNHTQWFEVNKVIIHPTYEVYHPGGGNIALVQLKTRIVFSDSVLPICIAPPDVTLLNLSCWVTGWGSISQQGDTSDKLQEVQLPLVPLPLCQLLYGHTSYILPDMLCAGDLRDMKTACEFTRNSSFFWGDSGGPLVCEFNHTWMQIGVVSWGHGCTYPMYPAVYARVSFFSEWIHYHVENTPLPLQPLPTLSSTAGAAINVLVTSLAVLSTV